MSFLIRLALMLIADLAALLLQVLPKIFVLSSSFIQHTGQSRVNLAQFSFQLFLMRPQYAEE